MLFSNATVLLLEAQDLSNVIFFPSPTPEKGEKWPLLRTLLRTIEFHKLYHSAILYVILPLNVWTLKLMTRFWWASCFTVWSIVEKFP
jgi:hypothetical protein